MASVHWTDAQQVVALETACECKFQTMLTYLANFINTIARADKPTRNHVHGQ